MTQPELPNLIFLQYYLTNSEIEVLENYAEQIAHRIQPGSILVELGSG